ncbi:hypothetical protein JW898_01825 [Candidatus Woesearchaeota archaeon]|nr:hypothetical protein [Candidatus Woesearchaeota archaeon]
MSAGSGDYSEEGSAPLREYLNMYRHPVFDSGSNRCLVARIMSKHFSSEGIDIKVRAEGIHIVRDQKGGLIGIMYNVPGR